MWPKSSCEIEHRIKNAINMYKYNQIQRLARIIYNFQVPYQQLLQYIHGIPSKHNNQPDKLILNREQREAFKNQIIHLDDTHYPSTVK